MNKSQAVVHDDRHGIDCCWTKKFSAEVDLHLALFQTLISVFFLNKF